MNNSVIIIGNDGFSNFNEFEPEYTCQHYALTNDITTDIKYIKNADPKFVFVLLEIPCAKSTTQYGGLEFIIWLRINAVKLPVIAVSLQPLQNILKATRYANIFADKATYFYQYRKDFDKDEILKQIQQTTSINSIKSAIGKCFDIVHFRHSYANVWGLHRLVNTYNLIFPENQFLSNDITNESSLGLDYQIARFYYSQKENTNKYLIPHIEKKAKELKQLHNIRIVFLDDKADTGWLSFIKHLFDNSVEIINLIIPTFSKTDVFSSFKSIISSQRYFDKIFQINPLKPIKAQIETIILNKDIYHKIWSFVYVEYFNSQIVNLNKERKVDIVVSDLRLFPSDEQIENYQELVSMHLMKRVLKNGKFYKIKYILFTASNQILNFKFLFNHNQFAPSDIFIKEGFDIQYSADQKYINLDHLLASLLRATKQSTRSKTTILGKADNETDHKIDTFEKYKTGYALDAEFDEHYNFLHQFTHIILDTNLYLENKPLLALKCTNQFMAYPVAKELIRNLVKDGSEEIKAHLSSYFLNDLGKKINLDLASLNEQDRMDIDMEFKNKKAYQIADKYFLNSLQYYTAIKGNRVLFVTNDIKTNSTTNENSTVFDIIKWAAENQIYNLSICSFYQNGFRHHYPISSN